MGISAFGASGIKPGVCTSTTRPSAPYEGMMIYETDTNKLLVYGGSSWIAIVDLDTPPALELVTSGTFTNVATINVSDCFTSTYKNYRVLIDVQTASTQATRNITWKFRTSSGDDSTAQYYYGSNIDGFGGTTSHRQGAYAATSAILCNYYGYGDASAAIAIDVFQPEPSTTLTHYVGTAGGGNASERSIGTIACQMITAKSHTGFSFFSSTGNISGTYAVYGYRN